MEYPNHYEAHARDQQSAIGLLRRLVDEFSTLFRKEIALAKAEVVHGFSQVKAGAISMASGGAMLFAGIAGVTCRRCAWLISRNARLARGPNCRRAREHCWLCDDQFREE